MIVMFPVFLFLEKQIYPTSSLCHQQPKPVNLDNFKRFTMAIAISAYCYFSGWHSRNWKNCKL